MKVVVYPCNNVWWGIFVPLLLVCWLQCIFTVWIIDWICCVFQGRISTTNVSSVCRLFQVAGYVVLVFVFAFLINKVIKVTAAIFFTIAASFSVVLCIVERSSKIFRIANMQPFNVFSIYLGWLFLTSEACKYIIEVRTYECDQG